MCEKDNNWTRVDKKSQIKLYGPTICLIVVFVRMIKALGPICDNVSFASTKLHRGKTR